MRELVSALVDGEVSDADLELALAALLHPNGQQAWALYHQIGDAVRESGSAELSDAFASRLAARLDAEPCHVAPAKPEQQGTVPTRERGSSVPDF